MVYNLEEKIENYRRLMIISAEVYGITSPITIKISQRLDKLINEALHNNVVHKQKKHHPIGYALPLFTY
jgi:hypothetical protein